MSNNINKLLDIVNTKHKDVAFMRSVEVSEAFNMLNDSVRTRERLMFQVLETTDSFARSTGLDCFTFTKMLELLYNRISNQDVRVKINELISLVKQTISDTHNLNQTQTILNSLSLELLSNQYFSIVAPNTMHLEAFKQFQKMQISKLCNSASEVDILRSGNPQNTHVETINGKYLVSHYPGYRIWASQKYKPIDVKKLLLKYNRQAF